MTRLVPSLVTVVVLALTGCAVAVTGEPAPDPAAQGVATPTVDPVPAGVRFSDAGGRFTIGPPKGWKADTGGAQGTAVVFLAPTPTRTAGGSFTANINVLVVPSEADLPATVVGARRELRGLPAYTSTADQDAALLGGTQAHLLGGTFTDKASGLTLRNLQLFAVSGGSTTVVTGTAAAQAWDAYAAVFDMALRTLTVAG
jgi:hypothetical protein